MSSFTYPMSVVIGSAPAIEVNVPTVDNGLPRGSLGDLVILDSDHYPSGLYALTVRGWSIVLHSTDLSAAAIFGGHLTVYLGPVSSVSPPGGALLFKNGNQVPAGGTVDPGSDLWVTSVAATCDCPTTPATSSTTVYRTDPAKVFNIVTDTAPHQVVDLGAILPGAGTYQVSFELNITFSIPLGQQPTDLQPGGYYPFAFNTIFHAYLRAASSPAVLCLALMPNISLDSTSPAFNTVTLRGQGLIDVTTAAPESLALWVYANPTGMEPVTVPQIVVTVTPVVPTII